METQDVVKIVEAVKASGWTARDWTTLAVAIFVPLCASLGGAWVAFSLNKDWQHRQAIRQLFYALKQHAEDFRFGMYALLTHSQRQDTLEVVRGQFRDEIGQATKPGEKEAIARERIEIDRAHNEQGHQALLQGRSAHSLLNADKAMLKMLFGVHKPAALVEVMDQLSEMMVPFLTTQKGGRTPDYKDYKDLPIDATVDKLHEEIDVLWANAYHASAVTES